MDKQERNLTITTIIVTIISIIAFFLKDIHMFFYITCIVCGLLVFVFKREEEKIGYHNIIIKIAGIIGIAFAILAFIILFINWT